MKKSNVNRRNLNKIRYRLTSEMLKCSNHNLLNELKKNFNRVLDSSYYPEN